MSEAGGKQEVRFYFDFISPYSWLALMRAVEFGTKYRIDWDLRPIVYGKLLDATGLTGPGETPEKRRYMFSDIVRCARRSGLEIQGPPAHPFRSLEALRTACLYLGDPKALELCVSIADAAWGRGRDLTEIRVLQEVVQGVGLDPGDLRERIGDPAVKERLRQLTGEALESGVFGVPTFFFAGEMFWGQDRMSHLADRVEGKLPPTESMASRLNRRPSGADRRN